MFKKAVSMILTLFIVFSMTAIVGADEFNFTYSGDIIPPEVASGSSVGVTVSTAASISSDVFHCGNSSIKIANGMNLDFPYQFDAQPEIKGQVYVLDFWIKIDYDESNAAVQAWTPSFNVRTQYTYDDNGTSVLKNGMGFYNISINKSKTWQHKQVSSTGSGTDGFTTIKSMPFFQMMNKVAGVDVYIDDFHIYKIGSAPVSITNLYGNRLAYGDAENGKPSTIVTGVLADNTQKHSGDASFKAANYPNAGSYITFTPDKNLEANKIYNISFWIKQESVSTNPNDLWDRITGVMRINGSSDSSLSNDTDYFATMASGGINGGISLNQTTDWQFKSIIYAPGTNVTTGGQLLYFLGTGTGSVNSAVSKVNLWLDDVAIREVPNPEKYTSTLFNGKVVKSDAAEDGVISDVALTNSYMDSNSINLTFSNTNGNTLGRSGINTLLMDKNNLTVLGKTVADSDIKVTNDFINSTSTLKIPIEPYADTTQGAVVTFSNLKDIWGKTISCNNINFASADSQLSYGNLITNANCESKTSWEGDAVADYTDYYAGSASLKAAGYKTYGGVILAQTLAKQLVQGKTYNLSFWIKQSDSAEAVTHLLTNLRTYYTQSDGTKKYTDKRIFSQQDKTLLGVEATQVNHDGNWQYKKITFQADSTIPAGSTITGSYLYVMYVGNSDSSYTYGSDFSFDNFSFREQPAADINKVSIISAFLTSNGDLVMAFDNGYNSQLNTVVVDKNITDSVTINGIALNNMNKSQITDSSNNTTVYLKTTIADIITSPAIITISGMQDIWGRELEMKSVEATASVDGRFMVSNVYATLGADWFNTTRTDGMKYFGTDVIDGRTRVSAFIYNATDTAVAPVRVYAKYSNNVMTGCAVDTLPQIEPQSISANTYVDVLSDDKNSEKLKIMYWNSFNEIQPLSELLNLK